jgi:hypothetical protein
MQQFARFFKKFAALLAGVSDSPCGSPSRDISALEQFMTLRLPQ